MSAGALVSEQIKSVLDVSRLLAVTTELDPLLQRIAEAAATLLDCERASIFLHDPQTGELWTKVALQTPEIRIPAELGVAGHAFAANRILHVSDPYLDPHFDARSDRRSGFVTRNLLAVPLLDIERQPLGVIEAVNKHNGDFTAEDRALIPLFAEQAGVAIQRYRLQNAAVQIVALRREMELARQVQEAMIPRAFPQLAGWEIAAWTRPASITGGDMYDAWTLPDGRLALFIADASGHGMGAALLVHQARALARAISPLRPDPCDTLQLVHEQLAHDLKIGWFVTGALAFLAADGTCQWCSAGHGPIFVRRGVGSPHELSDPALPPLGVAREWNAARPEPVQLASGGRLVFLTDGIHESMNPAGDLFGLDRVAVFLDSQPELSSNELVATLVQTAQAWRGAAELLDDQAILVAGRSW